MGPDLQAVRLAADLRDPVERFKSVGNKDDGHEMRRFTVVLLVVVALSIGTIAAVAIAMNQGPDPVACGSGGDLESQSCREAEASCKEDGHSMQGAADGDGFSYGFTCDDDGLTSFTFS